MEYKYLKPHKDEISNLLLISAVLGFMFSYFYFQFDTGDIVITYLMFIIFIFVLLFTRLIFMKYVAYYNDFELILTPVYFQRYWLRPYDKLPKKMNFILINIAIFVFTAGYLIIPSSWFYKRKKIPHRHAGTQQHSEVPLNFFFNVDISDYRFCKVMFFGFFYYFLAGFILKMIFIDTNTSFYNWFTFTLYWIAFISLIPVPFTEGYEFFMRSWVFWVSALTVLVIGMIYLLVFQSLWYVILMFVFSTIIVLVVFKWKSII